MYVCMYVCMYMYIHVYTCIYMYIYVYTCKQLIIMYNKVQYNIVELGADNCRAPSCATEEFLVPIVKALGTQMSEK